MFSALGPMFKTVFRQTESADARLEIKREEKEDGRKKKSHDTEDENTDALWEDSTSVSVGALRTFLLEFLKNQGHHADHVVALDTAEPTTIIEQKPVVSSVAARAVKAYTSMTAAVNYTPPPAPAVESATETSIDPASELRAEEIRAILGLIADLDGLAKGGIDTLNIQMNGTFLESAIEAVRLVKSGL